MTEATKVWVLCTSDTIDPFSVVVAVYRTAEDAGLYATAYATANSDGRQTPNDDDLRAASLGETPRYCRGRYFVEEHTLDGGW